jgi:hypothetical protein
MDKTVARRMIAVTGLAVLVLASSIAQGGSALVPVSLGICQPETDATAEGWDTTPYPGHWGDKDVSLFAVVWAPGDPDEPALVGREAKCTIPGSPGMHPDKIKLNYLMGLANDDFCVFVEHQGFDIRLGCVNEESAVEQWEDAEFDVPEWWSSPGRDVTVKILVTGDSWSSKGTYGQFAVDYIEVLASPGRTAGRR